MYAFEIVFYMVNMASNIDRHLKLFLCDRSYIKFNSIQIHKT